MVLFGLDDVLISDASVCPTAEAKATCKNTSDASCITLASQLTPSAQANLKSCLGTPEGRDDVTTCAGSFL